MAIASEKEKALKKLYKAQEQLQKIKKQEALEEEQIKKLAEDALRKQAEASLPKFSKWFAKDLGTDRRKINGSYETIQITPIMAAMEVIQIQNYLAPFKSFIKSVIIDWYAEDNQFNDFAVYLEIVETKKVSITEMIYFIQSIAGKYLSHPPFPWNIHGTPDEVTLEEIQGRTFIRIWWD